MINVDAYCIYKYMKNDENSTRTTSTILLFHNFLGQVITNDLIKNDYNDDIDTRKRNCTPFESVSTITLTPLNLCTLASLNDKYPYKKGKKKKKLIVYT